MCLFEALYFHSFLKDVLVSLHSAYWFSLFFFPSWSDPWGRDARQGCPNHAPLFFVSWLSIFYPDFLWWQTFSHPSIFNRACPITPNILSSSLSTTDSLNLRSVADICQAGNPEAEAEKNGILLLRYCHFVWKNYSACSCSIYAHLYLW